MIGVTFVCDLRAKRGSDPSSTYLLFFFLLFLLLPSSLLAGESASNLFWFDAIAKTLILIELYCHAWIDFYEAQSDQIKSLNSDLA